MIRSIVVIVALVFVVVGCRNEHPRPAEGTDSTVAVSAPNRGYTITTLKNSGTIRGKVLWKRKRPELSDFEVSPECSGAAKDTRFSLGKDDGVAKALVMVQGIRSGKPFDSEPVEGNIIRQQGCRYKPDIKIVRTGVPVVFLNDEDMPHNVRVEDIQYDSMLMNKAQPVRGKADTIRFNRQSFYELSCDYHPWMNGYIIATETPYNVLTNADGEFVIDGVPEGTYSVKVFIFGLHRKALKDNNGTLIRYSYQGPDTEIAEVQVKAGTETRVTVTF